MSTRVNFISSTSVNLYNELHYYRIQIISRFNTSSPVQYSTISTTLEHCSNPNDIIEGSFQETNQVVREADRVIMELYGRI